MDQKLLLLLRRQLLKELLLLLRIEALQRCHQLHSLLLELCLLLHRGGTLLDSRIHDILALALFLLWRHLIDDLLLLLGFLLSQQSCLLSRKLIILGGFLGRMMSTTLKGREEIIEQDTLARLHLSPFALGCLLLAIGGARLRCATAARAHRRNDVLGVNLSSRLCIVTMLLSGGLRVAGNAVMEHATGLWAFGGAAALGPWWEERG